MRNRPYPVLKCSKKNGNLTSSAQPLLPLPPASQSRQPSRCRACVDATDTNSAAHSPGNLPFPTPASSASNQVAPLFFSECSGSTTSEAGPTGGPACPATPPTPHPLGSIS